MKLPVTPGHEFSGRVVELGEDAQKHHGVDLGDLVVSEQIIACQKCRFCLKGQYQVKIDYQNIINFLSEFDNNTLISFNNLSFNKS